MLYQGYAALVHARGDIEQEAVRKITLLFTDDRICVCLPEREWNTNLKAEAFVSFSRMGAPMHYVQHDNAAFVHNLYRALERLVA